MPSIMEVHALPAPPLGGITGPLPEAQLPADGGMTDDKENGSESPPPPVPVPVVATHTRTIGMIHPPPDIRGIVDKTAQFVARNGPEFERRILANGRNNVKFNFLNPGDPYHAYYQHRVSEMKTQVQNSSQGVIPGTAPPGTAPPVEPPGSVQAVKEAPDAVKFEIPKPMSKVIDPPEAEQYTVRLPEGITGTELDIIKLTAQFVARNGRTFLHGLTHREVANQTFAFLKPTHSMFTFFTTLADAYSKVLMPQKGIVEKLKRSNLDRTTVLERCLHRLEWEKSQERARQKAEDEVEHERVQMALIDWHDFVVVETIEFADDEDDELPAPMTLEEVIRRSKALTLEEDEQIADAGKVVEMEMDDEEVQLVEDSMKAASLEEANSKANDTAMSQVPPSTDDTEPPMRIVKNWKRPEERLPAERDPTKFVVSPITGELIPINEMAEHMRISLIDPKYKEQKERMIAKLRETTLATDDEISRNIVGLARTRPDIFGTTEEEVSNAVKAEIEKKKEEPKQVIWDGHTGSISRTANQAMAQTMSSDEQAAMAGGVGGPLPGPMAPPKLAPPPVRPLPPPPGLALNMPRPPQTSGQSSAMAPPPSMPPLPRPAILPTPPLRPPLPVPMVNRPPPPPPMAVTTPAMVSGPPPMPQYPNLPPQPRPPMYPPHMPQPMQTMPLMPPPPPPQGMPPPPPPEEAPPPPPEEPEPKRQKLDEMMLIPEDQFLAQHPGAVRIAVAVPSVEGEGNLKGQTLEVTIHSLSETILSLKEKISGEIALPANKQKLSGRGGFFFKDNLSLAHYNVGPGETLTLALRERGGRKR
eukprot:c11289_g1_i2 orf=236-2677(-)